MKRWIALLTALCLLVSITALAEDVDLDTVAKETAGFTGGRTSRAG